VATSDDYFAQDAAANCLLQRLDACLYASK
jgi:hypothetical protein